MEASMTSLRKLLVFASLPLGFVCVAGLVGCAPPAHTGGPPVMPTSAGQPLVPRPPNDGFTCDPGRRAAMVAGGASATDVRFSTNCD